MLTVCFMVRVRTGSPVRTKMGNGKKYFFCGEIEYPFHLHMFAFAIDKSLKNTLKELATQCTSGVCLAAFAVLPGRYQ